MARVVKGDGRRSVILVRCLAVAPLILVPLLSGCGCSLFSRSARCDVVNGATAVVLLPVIGVSRAGEGISHAATRHAMRKGVLADDLDAQAKCLLICDRYFSWQESEQLVSKSAQHVLDTQDAAPSASALPMLMSALWHRARKLQQSDPKEAGRLWLRLATLSTDSRLDTPEKLEAWGHNATAGYYTSLAVDAQAALIRASRAGSHQAVMLNECQAQSPWPPAWLSKIDVKYALQEACSRAQKAGTEVR